MYSIAHLVRLKTCVNTPTTPPRHTRKNTPLVHTPGNFPTAHPDRRGHPQKTEHTYDKNNIPTAHTEPKKSPLPLPLHTHTHHSPPRHTEPGHIAGHTFPTAHQHRGALKGARSRYHDLETENIEEQEMQDGLEDGKIEEEVRRSTIEEEEDVKKTKAEEIKKKTSTQKVKTNSSFMKINSPTKLKRLKPVGRVARAVISMECKLSPVVTDRKLSTFKTLIQEWEDKSVNKDTVLTAAVIQIPKLEDKTRTANQGREDKIFGNHRNSGNGVIGRENQLKGASGKINQPEGGLEKISTVNIYC
jgi:hypothetical protein